MSDAGEPEVLFERRGAAAFVTLNRPKALNALTLGMVRAVAEKMAEWAEAPAVRRVVMQGAGGKAFCAGGDIRALYEFGRAGDLAAPAAFWREEYALNHALKHYPKPIVSLIDGIVMGGGVGLSVHGSHRVVTERLMFAMPEVGIGFFPDVGASHVLPRLPGEMGTYLALTGARIGRDDAMMLGLATHAVPSARVGEVAAALEGEGAEEDILSPFLETPGPAPLAAHAAEIAEAFAGESLPEIAGRLGRMAQDGSDFAARTLETMRAKSPTSMAIALEQMRRGRTMSFAEAMRMEFRIVRRIAEGRDFYEGVRAVIVDKDNRPRWRPAAIEEVEPAAVAAYFAALPDDLELG